jgi:hypothetical protein
LKSFTKTIDFSRYYQLKNPQANRPYFLTTKGYSDWLTLDYVYQLVEGRVKPEASIRIGSMMGGQATDFLWSSWIFIVCISKSLTDMLQEAQITGWTTYPVEIYGRNRELLPTYHGLAITGGACRRDRSRSTIETRQVTPEGEPFQVYKGLFFQEEDWDGSDFFTIKGCGIVVTEKVYQAFRKHKVTNAKLLPLTEVELDTSLDKYDHDL